MRFIDKENTPHEWTSQRISHYVEEHKGGAPLRPSDFSESGFPVIPKKAIQQGNKLVITKPTFCTKSFADKNTRSIVDTNYTITTLRDLVPTGPTIGTVVNFYSDEQYILSQGVYGLKLKSNIDRDYFAYVSNAPFYRKVMKRVMVGSTQVHIRTPEYLSLEIQLPPLPEQRKIATILGTWDKAISTTERLIDNSKQQKKALMQQLNTGKKRLLDDSGKPFEGEWSKIELGKLLDYKQPTPYLVKSTDYSDEYSIPVLTAGKTFILGYSNENFGIFEEELPAIIFDDFTTASKFVDFPFKAKSSAMKILVAKQGVSIKFVYETMQVLNYPVGGHQRHWISIFANLVIGLPSPAEQQKIASVLSNADKEIELLEQQLADLKHEKKALMQQLLTGKRRVMVDEREVA